MTHTSPLHQLTTHHLKSLQSALQENRLTPPFTKEALEQYVPIADKTLITQEMNMCYTLEGGSQLLIYILGVLIEEKRRQQRLEDRLELVWTGPEEWGSTARDTAVIVRELFERAQKSVLISTYSLDKASNMKTIFGDLATRMEKEGALQVKLFLNIKRDLRKKQTRRSVEHLFAQNFRKLWPGSRFPEVYFDPRSLDENWDQRSCLHAKNIIVDDRWMFVTSANFSEAAHKRNIEAGILMEDTRN